jgi:hypothetical protein
MGKPAPAALVMVPTRDHPPVDADERTTLTAFLDFQRATTATPTSSANA